MSAHTFSAQRLMIIGAFTLTVASGNLKAQADFSLQASSNAQVKSANGVTVLNIQGQAPSVDFVHAKPKPLPRNSSPVDTREAMMQALLSAADSGGPSGFSPSYAGDGKQTPVFLGKPEMMENAGVTPEDFGANNHPFTTARADLYTVQTNTTFPYRAAGKLFFNISGSSYICSASLLKRGIVVTAAHCVANYGQQQFYSGWQFTPGYRNGSAPFGVASVRQAFVLSSYYYGTDNCAVSGVVCPDDVAILVLNNDNGQYIGSKTGWLGYWYGAGFTSSGQIQITQLGYPAGLDSAAYMERNDSYGYKDSSNSNNTIIGSNMDGGSSGGPWLANFGLTYKLTGETNGSGYSFTNAVVGVTSWGYTSTAYKEQGASPFTSGNIKPLLDAACSSVSGVC